MSIRAEQQRRLHEAQVRAMSPSRLEVGADGTLRLGPPRQFAAPTIDTPPDARRTTAASRGQPRVLVVSVPACVDLTAIQSAIAQTAIDHDMRLHATGPDAYSMVEPSPRGWWAGIPFLRLMTGSGRPRTEHHNR